MSPVEVGSLAIVALLFLIYLGMPIGIGMLSVSFVYSEGGRCILWIFTVVFAAPA